MSYRLPVSLGYTDTDNVLRATRQRKSNHVFLSAKSYGISSIEELTQYFVRLAVICVNIPMNLMNAVVCNGGETSKRKLHDESIFSAGSVDPSPLNGFFLLFPGKFMEM